MTRDLLPDSPADRCLTRWFAVSACSMFIGVGMGAFGAHGLKNILDEYGQHVYEKAVFYHLVHALGAIGVACAARVELIDVATARRVLKTFLVGILLFSGSLYLLAITGERRLGMITPLGGALFLLAWGMLGLHANARAQKSGGNGR